MTSLIGRLANRAIDIFYFPGCERFNLRARRGRVACLLYHRVVEANSDPYHFITRGGVPAIAPDELASDLHYLKHNGAIFLTFDDLRAGLFPSKKEWGVIVTFDDCFADNYAQGIQVLSVLGIKAVFFQTSGLVDGQELIWEHQLYWYTRNKSVSSAFCRLANEVLMLNGARPIVTVDDLIPILRERTPLAITDQILRKTHSRPELAGPYPQLPGQLYPTSTQILDAHRLGHEIGSHGHMHFKRDNINVSLFRSDLEHSKSSLCNILGKTPSSYSFPFSNFCPEDITMCKSLFDVVATVERTHMIENPESRAPAPRFTWPGSAKNGLRKRRWLLTGAI